MACACLMYAEFQRLGMNLSLQYHSAILVMMNYFGYTELNYIT